MKRQKPLSTFWLRPTLALGLIFVFLVSCSPQSPAPNTPQAGLIQAVATSRGDNLQATDPATVSLASGELQMVEIFRFT